MILDGKTINRDYIEDNIYVPANANMKNKKFIDNWVNASYNRLLKFFSKKKYVINSRSYSMTDIYHDSLIRIYANRRIFQSQDEADNYLDIFFKQ